MSLFNLDFFYSYKGRWQWASLPLEEDPGEAPGGGARHVPLVGDGHDPGSRLNVSISQILNRLLSLTSSWMSAWLHGSTQHTCGQVITVWSLCDMLLVWRGTDSVLSPPPPPSPARHVTPPPLRPDVLTSSPAVSLAPHWSAQTLPVLSLVKDG